LKINQLAVRPEPVEGRKANCSPASKRGRCEKIGLPHFSVIPAEAGIQYFQVFKKFLDPGACPGLDPGFTGETTKKQFFHTFGEG
jgi:hypothetical protein